MLDHVTEGVVDFGVDGGVLDIASVISGGVELALSGGNLEYMATDSEQGKVVHSWACTRKK